MCNRIRSFVRRICVALSKNAEFDNQDQDCANFCWSFYRRKSGCRCFGNGRLGRSGNTLPRSSRGDYADFQRTGEFPWSSIPNGNNSIVADSEDMAEDTNEDVYGWQEKERRKKRAEVAKQEGRLVKRSELADWVACCSCGKVNSIRNVLRTA